MKLSELIQEMVEMLIEGPPENTDWQSISDVNIQQKRYYDYLEEVKQNIDDLVNTHKETK